MEIVRSKHDRSGRWVLEYTPANTWASFGKVGKPNKWVTLRALRALKAWQQVGQEGAVPNEQRSTPNTNVESLCD